MATTATVPTIEASNLGPIADLQFSLPARGVTVLTAPNGSGKSILLNGVAAAAAGKGRLPLKDNAKRGYLEAFGARVTIGASTRHNGDFDAVHLEGRFDLSLLVDPGLKSEAAADAKRIKALIHLLEVKADPALFYDDEAFDHDEFNAIVKPESLEVDDPVEMARRIKEDFFERARIEEAHAEQAIGMARAAEEQTAGVDTSLPHDEVELRAAYNQKRDEWKALQTKRLQWVQLRQKAQAAHERLTGAEQTVNVEAAEQKYNEAFAATEAQRETVDRLTRELQQAKADLASKQDAMTSAEQVLVTCRQAASIVEDARAEVRRFEDEDETTAEQVAQSQEQADAAAAAMDEGVRVRAALQQQQTAAGHRQTARDCRERAEHLRDTGSATEDVLSAAINSEYLAVRSVNGATRLVVTNHPRREEVGQLPYSELSHGERWRIAIDLAADQVGEGGLIVIPQEAWEGLDSDARLAVHEHAVKRGVYALAAEASQNGERRMVAEPYAVV